MPVRARFPASGEVAGSFFADERGEGWRWSTAEHSNPRRGLGKRRHRGEGAMVSELLREKGRRQQRDEIEVGQIRGPSVGRQMIAARKGEEPLVALWDRPVEPGRLLGWIAAVRRRLDDE